MSVQSKLPAFITSLGYMAAGFALSVSWAQMQSVLAVQADLQGEYIKVALPAAVLFGGTVLWRLAGHLYNRSQNGVRSFGFAFALTILGALFTETISIGTSGISLAMNVNRAAQQDIENRASYQSGERLSKAAGEAAARLQQDLANMPENYRTESRKSSQALVELLQAQTQLAEVQERTAKTGSATERTFQEVGERLGIDGDQVKYGWAFALALALSIIPLGIQFAFGATSDAHSAEKRAGGGLFGIGGGSMEEGENVSYLTPKKPQRRGPRPASAKAKRESVTAAAAIKHRDPMATTTVDKTVINPNRGMAVLALEALGFRQKEAQTMVDNSSGTSVEEWTRNAMRSEHLRPQPPQKRRARVEDLTRQAAADIAAGTLATINDASLEAYSTSPGTRQKIKNQLIEQGIITRQDNGRCVIAA